MTGPLKDVLMRRDGLTEVEADDAIADARAELADQIADGYMPFDFCEEQFGLEPDYLEELL